MVINIDNKDYTIVFNYTFVKYVMKKNNWTKFSEYDAFLRKFAFDENNFGPEHLELFGELILLGISAGTNKKVTITLDDVVATLWGKISLLQEVGAYFLECQPKVKDVVDPVARGKKKG